MKKLHEVINQEILDNLFQIYRDVAGTKLDKPTLARIKSIGEWRAGSKYWGESKFIINNDRVSFDLNLGPGRKPTREMKAAVKDFDTQVKEYLESQGIEYVTLQ